MPVDRNKQTLPHPARFEVSGAKSTLLDKPLGLGVICYAEKDNRASVFWDWAFLSWTLRRCLAKGS
jgi:hypothetical protein